jgi:hypothetical protein
MSKPRLWRVRVKRAIEDWVQIEADTPLQAELDAANMIGVISVFGGSAMRGDRPIDQVPPAGIEDEGDN